MFSVHYCLVVILLLFVTSSTGVALFRDIFKREASEGSSDRCGKVDPLIAIKTDVKSFTSPDFPNNYPVDLDLCSWRIRTNQGNQVIVSFLSMDVEPQRNCQYDYLVLYDGPDAWSPKVGQYCGTNLPQPFTSTLSEVFVTFHSDEADSFKGFEIGYQAIGEFDDLVIESTDEDDTKVSGDSIGENSSAKPLIGGGEEDHTEGPDAENDFSGEKSEEDADSQFVEEVGDCNQIWHNARQGNITSLRYPNQYPRNKDCTIEINAPINRRIDLTFSFFDLEEVPCIFDYVIIKNSSAEDADVGRYCGNNVPGLIQSFTRQLIIKFVSDSADQKGGFYASFTTQESELVNNGLSKQPDGDRVLEFIIQPMHSLDLQVGDLVEKECEVNKEGAVFSWLKDDNLLPEGKATEGIVIDDDGKTLVIPRMEEKHQGDFVCKAHLPGGPLIIAPFSLRVTDEAFYSDSVLSYDYSADSSPEDESEEDSELFATVPMAATISEGANHVFFCSTNAVVDLFWEKDGRHLDLNARIYEIFEANLIVSDARMADSGMYSCAAYSKTHSDKKLGVASAYLSVTSGLEVSNVCGTVRAQGVVADESTEEDKGKIVNGQTALKGSSPWIARLWRRSNMEPFCGGSLINYRWVVTAASCFQGISKPEHLEVRLGDHDTLLIEPEEIRMQVSRYIIHPDFNLVTYDSDIALIELESRVQSFTNYITPICLPNVRTSDELLVPGETAHVAGWGQIIEDGAYPRYLKELNIPIVLQRSCKESTEDYVSDNMFCAGYSQALKGDTCQGDSGGPLAQEMDGKWYMTGISSWGEGCAREGKYGFYTKVVQFIDWLTESMTS